MSWFRLVPQKLPSLPAETHESPPSSLLHAPRCATVSHDSAIILGMPPMGMPPGAVGAPAPGSCMTKISYEPMAAATSEPSPTSMLSSAGAGSGCHAPPSKASARPPAASATMRPPPLEMEMRVKPPSPGMRAQSLFAGVWRKARPPASATTFCASPTEMCVMPAPPSCCQLTRSGPRRKAAPPALQQKTAPSLPSDTHTAAPGMARQSLPTRAHAHRVTPLPL